MHCRLIPLDKRKSPISKRLGSVARSLVGKLRLASFPLPKAFTAPWEETKQQQPAS